MLTLHAHQLVVFAQVAEARFERRLVTFLREQFPDARAALQRVLVDHVRTQMSRAERYLLTTEQQLAIYVATAWLLGADFDERFPEYRRVLRSPLVDGNRKAKFLSEHTRAMFRVLERGR